MSTLRVSNIEAKSDPSSSTADEQVKITNSNGDVLLYVDGRTSGITTVGINTTAEVFKVDSHKNFEYSGIITAASFSGPITGTTGNFGGDVTISGNLGVGGTITYEDVARVDATGISTFREGFKLGPLAGIALTAYKDGSIRTSGIITAASFVGDGSGLTGAGPTLANGSNNRVVTATGANALNGEAALTFDGTILTTSTDVKITGASGNQRLTFNRTNAAGSNGNQFGRLIFNDNNANQVAGIEAIRSSAVDDADITFKTRPAGGTITERVRIDSLGRVGINTVTHADTASGLTVRNGVAGSEHTFLDIVCDDNETSRLYFSEHSNTGSGSIRYSYTSDNNYMSFFTNGTGATAERLRISSSGRIYIGQNEIPTPLDGNSHIAIHTQYGASGCGIEIKHTGNPAGGRDFVRFYNKTDGEAGSIEHPSANATAFQTSSDYRLKENIVDITDGIERLKLLKPRRFSWIEDPELGLRDGFIAHEVSSVIPHCVSGEKDAVEENGKMKTQKMEYSQLTPLLTAALQEAIVEIETLKAEVAALKSS